MQARVRQAGEGSASDEAESGRPSVANHQMAVWPDRKKTKVPEPDPSEDAKGGSGTDGRNASLRPDRVGWATN
jgi:hypothetical protein